MAVQVCHVTTGLEGIAVALGGEGGSKGGGSGLKAKE